MRNFNLVIPTILFCILVINSIYADDDKRKSRRNEGVQPVLNELYREECGQCHFAYSPGLLPEKSWQKLLSLASLKDHFGEELEFTESDRNRISTYLINNSAEKSNYKRSRKIMKQISRSEVPLRITSTRYIKNKHRKIPQKLIADNDKVGSLSNCNSCHKEADKGIFDDDTVSIPGYGRWDDD
ncbi:MAG: cytochrome C [Deltaproteobacteria bacterium]|jgi:hypothetical protein|nr:cytochrome C [Deltaproteobacteria bacterium]MBT4637786.1 cytochrome C [Deltaproteobacteria bacterium]MBT6504431.1 cytochrome C [Deltaproteobacteria bacterium]MBT7887973.1 cytochrome C [Deltaproteobacteria bacterium]